MEAILEQFIEWLEQRYDIVLAQRQFPTDLHPSEWHGSVRELVAEFSREES